MAALWLLMQANAKQCASICLGCVRIRCGARRASTEYGARVPGTGEGEESHVPPRHETDTHGLAVWTRCTDHGRVTFVQSTYACYLSHTPYHLSRLHTYRLHYMQTPRVSLMEPCRFVLVTWPVSPLSLLVLAVVIVPFSLLLAAGCGTPLCACVAATSMLASPLL